MDRDKKRGERRVGKGNRDKAPVHEVETSSRGFPQGDGEGLIEREGFGPRSNSRVLERFD